jgi:hypothetical protein
LPEEEEKPVRSAFAAPPFLLKSINEHLVPSGACTKVLSAISDVSSVEASFTTIISRGL